LLFSHASRFFGQTINYRLDQVLPETAAQHASTNSVILPLEAEYLTLLGDRLAGNTESLLFHLFQSMVLPVDDDVLSRKENQGITMTREAKLSLARLALEPLQDVENDDKIGGLEWVSRSNQIERMEFVRVVTARLVEQHSTHTSQKR